MTAYYNEIEPFAVQWLRNLIAAGLIAPGDVDDRSICDVRSADLEGYVQCHFFAGIGIWSHALREAGWPDSRPIWTGSCPCQPFSGANPDAAGIADDRHLWPDWWRLIKECGPHAIFGEQVDSPAARVWFDAVSTDLEGGSYACGSVVLNSAGFGAPNIRHRRFWVAYADRQRQERRGDDRPAEGSSPRSGWSCERSPRLRPASDGVGHPIREGLADPEPQSLCGTRWSEEGRAVEQSGGPHDPWRELEWLDCLDGKKRPTQPGLYPVAPRNTGDVGIIRGAGNAINAVVAREFIAAAMECLP